MPLTKIFSTVLPRILLAAAVTLAASVLPAWAQAPPAGAELLPLGEVRAGMKGCAYTIFAGDQVEKFDLEVIGVLPNFLGPRQAIILVQLLGEKVEHTGVVAGMSGSPVYLEGKLAGALSLKLGIFTKEAIAGVTPIADVLEPPVSLLEAQENARPVAALPERFSLRSGIPAAATLERIETPLVFSGFQQSTLREFAPQLAGYGFVAVQGGTAEARADDGQLHAGEMAGMVLVQGDASINSACTVTAVRGDQVFLCGHPFLGMGKLSLPMARSRVVTTLSSSLASTKIVNVGGPIGTITADHLTAVVGKLGPPPAMIPLDLAVVWGGAERKFHFEVARQQKLTPMLVAISTLNGLTQNPLYGEGNTLQVSGEVRIKGHASVRIENTYAPGDSGLPDGMPVALGILGTVSRLFSNTYEAPDIAGISLRVEGAAGNHSYRIESAWLDASEVAPGETVRVRVLLRPYRGEPMIRELSVRVPEQAARGTTLRVLVSDAEGMNRAARGFSPGGAGAEGGLEPFITLLNRERRNDRVYAGLFLPAPTLILEDKEMPNVPLSQINVLDGKSTPGRAQILRESLAGEDAVTLGGPVGGAISLALVVR